MEWSCDLICIKLQHIKINIFNLTKKSKFDSVM